MSRDLTYAEFVSWTRNHDLQRDADQKRIAALEARLHDLTEQLARYVGAERIAAISGEKRSGRAA